MKSTFRIAVPWTLALWAYMACMRPAVAQTNLSSVPTSTTAATPTPAILPAPAMLSVSLPPQVRLRLDVDARDGELLGVVKSLLEGFQGSALKEVIPQGNVPQGGAHDLNSAAVLQLLSNANLDSLLSNVSHLRAVVFETPRPQRPASTGGTAKPGVQSSAKQSVIAYYEQAYITREGGHRIMRADFDEVQLLTVGFPQNGFALVIQAPDLGVVLRSDGYPNLESVGPVATALFLLFTPRPR